MIEVQSKYLKQSANEPRPEPFNSSAIFAPSLFSHSPFMNWKAAFSTAIAKKLLMGATGLFLIIFLVVHCYINAQVFYNDGGVNFNIYAHFMGTNPIIRI